MCTSQRPTNGADSEEAMESVATVDRTCDYCGKVQFSDPLHQRVYGDRVEFLCDRCDANVVPENATFDEWMRWHGIAR